MNPNQYRRIKSSVTGPDGEPIRYQDVELPHQDLAVGRPSHPGALAEIAAEWSADVWQERHADCEAAWFCEKCEQPQCPRCHPSPAEFRLCAECSWFSGDAA